jgi:hypothetical protein
MRAAFLCSSAPLSRTRSYGQEDFTANLEVMLLVQCSNFCVFVFLLDSAFLAFVMTTEMASAFAHIALLDVHYNALPTVFAAQCVCFLKTIALFVPVA